MKWCPLCVTLSPFKESIEIFVKENFDIEGTELIEVTPTDWKKNPAFIDQIRDEKFKALASIMNDKWRNLTRKIAKSEEEIREKSSLIYLQHPFVVPGGRFIIYPTDLRNLYL